MNPRSAIDQLWDKKIFWKISNGSVFMWCSWILSFLLNPMFLFHWLIVQKRKIDWVVKLQLSYKISSDESQHLDLHVNDTSTMLIRKFEMLFLQLFFLKITCDKSYISLLSSYNSIRLVTIWSLLHRLQFDSLGFQTIHSLDL